MVVRGVASATRVPDQRIPPWPAWRTKHNVGDRPCNASAYWHRHHHGRRPPRVRHLRGSHRHGRRGHRRLELHHRDRQWSGCVWRARRHELGRGERRYRHIADSDITAHDSAGVWGKAAQYWRDSAKTLDETLFRVDEPHRYDITKREYRGERRRDVFSRRYTRPSYFTSTSKVIFDGEEPGGHLRCRCLCP